MRRQHMSPNLTLFNAADPLCIVRGEGCYIFDHTGKR
jgi:adenosylmethionine-8-amino-7-oxononanoate aminotransferase